MADNTMSDDTLYRQIVEIIESELSMDEDNFEIEIDEEEVLIQGTVPSIQAQEELERLLIDVLGLDNLDYDVVVDEDLQLQEESLPDSEGDELDLGGKPDISDINDSQRPRRQY